jgi:hypothetical protein
MTSRSYSVQGVSWPRARLACALVVLAASAALSACSAQRAPGVGQTWEDVCIDGDADGYGFQCTAGSDCDDADPGVHDGCDNCRKPGDGCACEAGAKPVDCSVTLSVDADGALVCSSGTRYCRDGEWSACEGVATFTVAAASALRVTSRALVDPDAPPVRCDPCHPGCFRIEDTMVTPPDYSLPPGLAVADGGGVTLAGEFPPDYVPPYSGVLDEAPCAADDMPDCDGLPTRFDPDPSRDPATSAHRTLFMDLPPGHEITQRVGTRVFLSSADVYFYMDATSTTRDEVLRLIADFRTGNFLPADGAGFDCVDADFDGAPDNLKREQGIAGNIACIVRDARFGAGWFREIPFYGPFEGTEQHVAPWDTEMFEHRHDISADISSVANALSTFTWRANENVPEGSMQGLWALATGGEIYAGWDRPGVPARTNCPNGTFGYPCFRDDALPIILHFTDAPMQGGPATRARPASGTTPATPANCLSDADEDSELVCDPLHYDSAVLSGMMSGSEGRYRALQTSAESPAQAEPVGAIDNGLVTYVGNNEHMASDVTYASLGGFACPPSSNAWSPSDQGSPDVVFRFSVGTPAPYLISGRGTRFDATFMLFALNAAGTPSAVIACSDTAVHLDQGEELDYAPEIERTLSAGNYLLVLKGYRSARRGMFQVSFGRRAQQTRGSFAAKRWLGPLDDGVSGVREALASRDIRVIPIQSGSDGYALEQATELSEATGASPGDTPLVGAVGNDVTLLGDEVVRVVRELALATRMNVSLGLSEQPHAASPPFGMRVEAVLELSNGCTGGVGDGDGDGIPDTHFDCAALARPRFDVTFSNGEGASAVPPNSADAQGGYHMWLRVLGNRRYLLDQIPVYLIPTDVVPDPVPPLRSEAGAYEQEISANGCAQGEGPTWLSLLFEADLPADTRMTFEMCAADSAAALAACTFTEVASVTRGSACVEQAECGTDGYCSPSGFCHRVVGVACENDEQCGTFGSCQSLGGTNTCTYARNMVNLLQSTAQMRGWPRARVRARMSASSDRTQAPTLLRWTLDYSCAPLE